MSGLERKLEEDRAVRDAARRLVEADLAFVRGDVQDRSLARRAADGVSDTSLTFADRAVGYARAHPLVVSGGLAAVLLFLLRNSLIDLAIDLLGDDEDEADASEKPAPPPPSAGPAPAQAEPGAAESRSKPRWFQPWRESR